MTLERSIELEDKSKYLEKSTESQKDGEHKKGGEKDTVSGSNNV